MEKPQTLFEMQDNDGPLELIYSASANQMSAEALGEAIVGMSTMMKIAGHALNVEFEDVYVYAIEKGSVKTLFVLVKRVRGKQKLTPLGENVVGGLIVLTVELIALYSLGALKNPSPEIMKTVDKNVLELCMNSEYRKSVGKVAKPLNEENEKVVIKQGNFSCEITRNNQYKYLIEDQEPVLPELVNGSEVTLPGMLTRMNLENNDLGFEYHGRKLSIVPADPRKHVATEFYSFLPTPHVIITGTVVRNSLFAVPKIKVVKMEVYKVEQTKIFGDLEVTQSAQ